MRLVRVGLGAAALLAALSLARAETAAAPKRKLTQIQRDLAKKREDLERYRRKLASLQERMGREQDRIDSYRAERETLEAKHKLATGERKRLQSDLDSIESRLQSTLEQAGGSAELYYTRTLTAGSFFSGDELWGTAALRHAVSGELQRVEEIQSRYEAASREADTAVRRAAELLARSRDTRLREREARKKLERRRRDVDQTQRRVASTEARVKELEASATELDRLVARLARRPAAGPLGKHSLPWPARGSIVARFGRQRLEAYGTWIVHHGIGIATEPGADVTPVRPGRIVYAGPFRSYGEVVIVDHGGGFVTVYGHLGRVLKATGDDVGPGDVIGTAGQSLAAEAQLVKLPEGRGSVYFEIRKGNEAVDPLKWLRKK
jgi:septal ring factor EnvC (AmiA/AmiB activator)